jgi:hypothetical protein
MADIGIEPHVIEAALNHYSGHRAGVAGIYNRSSYESAREGRANAVGRAPACAGRRTRGQCGDAPRLK